MTESKEVNYIDFNLMEKMCHPIAVALFDSKSEPMTRFNDHERSLLESALNNPRQTFSGKDLYPTISKKAAVLYYSMIKNHPFKNGNKRTATAALLVFLFVNSYRIVGNRKDVEDYLVNLAKEVANSIGSQDRDLWLSEIEEWLNKHIKI